MTSQLLQSAKVVVIEPGYELYETERNILSPFGAQVTPVAWNGDRDVITRAVTDADAVLVRESPISEEAVMAMARCRVIVRYGVGTDNINLEAARKKGIPVANVPSYGIDAVSDHALALMLAINRRIITRDHEVRAGQWGIGQQQKILPLRGATLGIFGFGKIARRAHEKFKVIGFERTLVVDPGLTDKDANTAGVQIVDLETLCRESDVISLHAPLNDATRHAFNQKTFDIMKSTAILINVGRGPLVDEAALIKALKEKRISGAGLDVFETEPPDQSNPLFQLDNVVLSDHGAWYSEASVAELQTKAAEEVARAFRGERPLSWVNRWED
ncbi:MAG: C-terminal binding protein [Rhodospirillales bacterium]|nr:C-terminal binding protein [Rhodospirillales bacterium]